MQVHLATDKLGPSVDECDALLKKHDAFERLITSQEEKVSRTALTAERSVHTLNTYMLSYMVHGHIYTVVVMILRKPHDSYDGG